ncbi:TolC family protein [Chitinophaga defluvii]|uniref:TolC family protein n=1 Tax=Chitinophaga defluvii TaxID=3163343 RepID=A0ABV2TB14_9BACT
MKKIILTFLIAGMLATTGVHAQQAMLMEMPATPVTASTPAQQEQSTASVSTDTPIEITAQAVPSDLLEMIQQSFGHYAQLKSLYVQQKIAADKTQLTKTSRMPDINGSAGYNHLYPVSKIALPGSDATFQAFPAENYNIGVSGRQLLLDFGKSGGAVNESIAAQNLLQLQTEEARETLAYQVANVYLNIAFVNQNIGVQDANIQLLEETEKIVSQKLKHGDAIDLDLLNTKVKLESYRNKKIDFENQLKKQVAILQYLTGAAASGVVKADFNWPAAPENITGSADVANSNAAIRTALEQEKVAALALKTAKTQYMPSLFLDAGTGFKNGYLPQLGALKYNYSAGVTLSVPIFHGKKLHIQENIAAQQIAVAKLHTQEVTDNLQKDIAEANADIQTSREKLITSEALLQQAERALQLAQSRYRNGVITFLDLQNAQTSQLEAQLSKVASQYQLSIAGLALLHLTGNQFWK